MDLKTEIQETKNEILRLQQILRELEDSLEDEREGGEEGQDG